MATSRSGLSGFYAKLVFALALVLSALTALIACTSDHGLAFIKILILINLIGLIALTWDAGEYFGSCLGFAILYGPLLIYAAFVQSPLLYLLGLVIPIVALTGWIITEGKIKSFVHGVYALWVVIGILFTLGRLRLLGNHDWAQYISDKLGIPRTDIHWFWDTRIIVTTVLLVVVAAKSVSEVFSTNAPLVPGIGDAPSLSTRSSGLVAALIDPFAILINALLLALWKLADLLWILIATILSYMGRILACFGRQLVEATIETPVWTLAARGCGAGMLVFFIGRGTQKIAPVAQAYLLADRSSGALSAFALLAGFSVLFAGAISLHMYLLDGFGLRDHLEIVGRGHASVAVAFFCAGMTMHVLVWMGLRAIKGFGALGPFSITMVTVLTIIIVREIYMRAKGADERKHTRARSARAGV
jgi:hypothetical protein